MRTHHIAYLVKNIRKSETAFNLLGYAVEQPTVYDAGRDIYIMFLSNENTRLELVQPASPASPLYPLLKKYKNSPYHICYETACLADAAAKLEQNGYALFKEPQRAPALGNRKVAFFINSAVGIIELLETEVD